MNNTKVFTGSVSEKDSKFGTITQLSWSREQYQELGKYINEKGYLNIDLLRSRENKPYMKINTYGVNID